MAADSAEFTIFTRPGGIELRVKVVPGASRTRLVGPLGDALRVAVAAPPEGGKANAALVKLLAELLAVKRSEITIVSGHTNQLKRVAVAGLTEKDARTRLTCPGNGSRSRH
jgi:uncharacterized protein